MQETLKEYEYMWDGTSTDWVLVRCNDADDSGEYSIYNGHTKMVCIIEDEAVHKEVCNKLLAVGADVLPRLPQSEFNINDMEIEND